ncbi:RluA family pseudouridine synthase [Maribacter sp. HTCC2170]|uniref:RluA family pseudouridine synthase n=1 Tax=Maribacter sp. (strain HTCC2170 / KCCM 42371) TaxID=313603 RepID=UPI0011D271E6|nr:RluA family pseudouridine synthase [Maribacter sp. HTCC2170]
MSNPIYVEASILINGLENIINPNEIHIVPKLSKPIRLQEYGVGIFNMALTKSALKKALKKQYITVNNVIGTTATFIHGGETIKLSFPKKTSSKKTLLFPLKMLYEDEHLAAIHKPSGILVSGNSFKTITHALSQNLEPSNLPDSTLPQPVHRLDYATTGILLIGKTSSVIRALNGMFERKEIKKTYYAITMGKMEIRGEVTLKIDNKNAQSKYVVEETVPSERFGQLNLVKLTPITGRRHQLRIHMSGIGNPILGDSDYGTKDLILKGKGLYLHAYSIEFNHPYTNEKLLIKSEFPKRFKKIFP